MAVPISVYGTRPDPDGYTVVLRDGEEELASEEVGPDGGTARFPGLAPGDYAVGVESVADHCSVEGASPRRFTVREGEIARVEFAVSCPGPGGAAVYERTRPEDHSERYILEQDGDFVLDYGPFEYSGRYLVMDSQILFDFDGSSGAVAWRATGAFRGDCMIVDYNVAMNFADFEDGEYCRLPES